MATETKIEWCDHTFNPWEGCTHVSPGCAHCYAATRNARFGGGTAPNWGPGAPRRRTSSANWRLPLKWNAHPWATGTTTRRPRVFCASLADWLDDEVPAEWRHDLLNLIRGATNLDWLLLTKRPQNWRKLMEQAADEGSDVAESWLDGIAPANVWIGTTTEDQPRAEERLPHLLSIPARVRFLSCEPLLGPLDLTPHLRPPTSDLPPLISWVIVGGESSHHARPMSSTWARALLEQCDAAGVPFFFKQWGEWLPEHQEGASRARKGALVRGVHTWPDGSRSFKVGKLCAGHLLDGIEHHHFPAP